MINSALYPASDHVDRLSKYPNPDYLKVNDIDFPTPISQIPKVEKQNNLAINVYGYTMTKKTEKITIFPYHLSEQPNEMARINLLLISEDVEVDDDDDNEEGIIDENYDPDANYPEPEKETKYHYCWIKNLNRLLYDPNKHKGQTFFCDRCLQGFSREDLLTKHKED